MIVDVHTHLIPEAAFRRLPTGMRTRPLGGERFELLADGGRALGRDVPVELRELAELRARQAAERIDVSIVAPWLDPINLPIDLEVQRAWCRTVNESFGELLVDEQSAYYLAAVPDLDGVAAAEEVEWAARHGAAGVALTCNPHDADLGRSDFNALWAVAEREGMPIVLHPSTAEVPVRLQHNFASVLVANPFETTLAAFALIAAGVPDRFPRLRLVLVHGGGFLPYQYGRMFTGLERLLGRRPSLAGVELLRWFRYDTVLFEREPLGYLLDLVGVDAVMAGSDCPFPMMDALPYRDQLASLGLDQGEVAAVRGGNAARTFRLQNQGESRAAPQEER